MFYEQLEILCKEIGTTPTNFTVNVLKLSSSKVTAWKGGSIPKYEILQQIANYFHVTIGELFDGKRKSSPSKLTENEQRMLDIFSGLTPTQQGELIGRASIMSEQNDAEAKKKDRVS